MLARYRYWLYQMFPPGSVLATRSRMISTKRSVLLSKPTLFAYFCCLLVLVLCLGSCVSAVSETDVLNDTVKLTEIVAFRYGPDHHQSEIKILERVSANAYELLGTRLLDDEYGTIIPKIKKARPTDESNDIILAIFRQWLSGKNKTPRTWNFLIQCLHDAGLYTLAGDIEYALSTSVKQIRPETLDFHSRSTIDTPSTDTPSTDTDTELQQNEEIKDFKRDTIETIRDIVLNIHNEITLGCQEPKLQEVHRSVEDMLIQLEAGKCHIGIIGMRSSEKTTILNSLLGEEFIPASVLPWVTNNITIVHDTSVPAGKLVGVGSVGEKRIIAIGKRNISESLKHIDVRYAKLVLYVAIPFLARNGIIDKVLDLELIDHSTDINECTAQLEAILRKSCMIVLVVDYRLFSDLDLFVHSLTPVHPLLFSKLRRSLFVVSSYDKFFSDYPEALGTKPREISGKLIKKLNSMGLQVQPQHVIPLSAKWALRARQWKNTSVLVSHHKAKILYDEAMLMLRQAGNTEEADSLRDEMSHENIEYTVSLLESFSQIDQFETALLSMLPELNRDRQVENPELVYVIDATRKAVNDVIRRNRVESETIEYYITSLSSLKQAFEEAKRIHRKEMDKLHHVIIDTAFGKMKSSQVTSLKCDLIRIAKQSFWEHIEPETCTLTKRMQVITRVQNITRFVATLAQNTMKNEWIGVSYIFKLVTSEVVKRNLQNLEGNLRRAIQRETRHEPDLNSLELELFSYISNHFKYLRESSICFFPESPMINLEQYALESDHLLEELVVEKSEKACKLVSDEVCYDDPDDCVKRSSKSCTYSKHYSLNLYRLEYAFVETFQNWIELFQVEVQESYHQLSVSVISAIKDKLSDVIDELIRIVERALNVRKQAWNRFRRVIDSLRRKQVALTKLLEDCRFTNTGM